MAVASIFTCFETGWFPVISDPSIVCRGS